MSKLFMIPSMHSYSGRPKLDLIATASAAATKIWMMLTRSLESHSTLPWTTAPR